MLFLSTAFSFAQELKVTGIRTGEFPILRTNIVANDNNGNPYEDIDISNFTINDNGYDVTPSASLTCKESKEPPPLSIQLVVDLSQSMEETDEQGESRLDYAKQAIEAFVNTIDFVEGTTVAVTGFSAIPVLICPFTSDKQEILDSLQKITLATVTRYMPAFVERYVGGNEYSLDQYLETRPDNISRIAIFLTDGLPDDLKDTDPDRIEKRNDAIDSLNADAITLYSITLLSAASGDLELITIATGGRPFIVNEKEQLIDIYNFIALEAQSNVVCELSWESPYGCDVSTFSRGVTITFETPDGKGTVNESRFYNVGPEAIADYVLSDNSIFFGRPAENESTSRTLTLEPQNARFVLDDPTRVQTIPPTFFEVTQVFKNDIIANYPITVEAGDKLDFEIVFTQGNQISFRQAKLILETDLYCQQSIELLGGLDQVIITSPTSTDLFSTCEDIIIQWDGIGTNDEVELSYSADMGVNYNIITSNATGLEYNWDNYPGPGIYRIKAVKPASTGYKWAFHASSENDILPGGLALNDDETKLFFAINFNNEGLSENTAIEFPDGTIITKTEGNDQDILIGMIDTDGNLIWHGVIGGGGNDQVNGVSRNGLGKFVITGYASNKAVYSRDGLPDREILDRNDLQKTMFAALITEDGVLERDRKVEASETNPGCESEGLRVKLVTNPITELVIHGTYENTCDGLTGGTGRFTYLLDHTDLDVNLLADGFQNGGGFPSDKFFDSDSENEYEIATFNDSRDFGSFDLTSAGGSDVFISKFGPTRASEDISEDFEIKTPVITLSIPVYDFGQVPLGRGSEQILNNIITNTFDKTISITGVTFTGADADNFSDQSIPSDIGSGQSEDFELRFTPDDLRNDFLATMIIGLSCGGPLELELKGEGICATEHISSLNLDGSNIQTTSSLTFQNVYKNENDALITLTPIIDNDPNDVYEIVEIRTSLGSVYNSPIGTIDLQGLEEITEMIIEFTPQTGITYNSEIIWDVSADQCEDKITDLTGFGIDIDVLIEAPDFGIKRIKTVTEGSIFIRNNGTTPIEMETLVIQEADSPFTLVDTDDVLPATIGDGSNIELKVTFNPQLEQEFIGNLLATQKNGINSAGQIKGIGSNPLPVAELNCPPQAIPVGDSDPVSVTFKNTGSYESITLTNVVVDGTEYLFENNDLTGIELQPNSEPGNEVTVSGTFRPAGIGPRTLEMETTGSFGEGNNIDEGDGEFITTTNLIASSPCDGESSDIEIPVNFGDVLICTEYTIDLQISNPYSQQITIPIAGIDLNDPDGVFSINVENDIVLGISGNTSIPVTFRPIGNNVNYSATLTLNSSVGDPFLFNLMGRGATIEIITDIIETRTSNTFDNVFDSEIGQLDTLLVSAKIPPLLSQNPIPQFQFKLNMVKTLFVMDINAVEAANAGKQFIFDEQAYGYLVTAQTDFNVVDQELFRIPMITLLPVSETFADSVFKIEPLFTSAECSDQLGDGVNINVPQVCGSNLRVIDFGEFQEGQIFPQPADGNLTVKYSVIFDSDVSIEIMDYMGNPVKLFNEYQHAGRHELVFDTSDIPSGSYLLHYRSSLVDKTSKISITK